MVVTAPFSHGSARGFGVFGRNSGPLMCFLRAFRSVRSPTSTKNSRSAYSKASGSSAHRPGPFRARADVWPSVCRETLCSTSRCPADRSDASAASENEDDCICNCRLIGSYLMRHESPPAITAAPSLYHLPHCYCGEGEHDSGRPGACPWAEHLASVHIHVLRPPWMIRWLPTLKTASAEGKK
jgi:hypothetical protein